MTRFGHHNFTMEFNQSITANNPRTDTGKPVFMTDLQMHLYKLCDNILEYNDTIFGENNYNWNRK